MKTKTFITIFLCLWLSAALATVSPVQKVSSSKAGISLRVQSPSLKLEDSSFRGEVFQRLSLEGASSAASTGEPDLPLYSAAVILPPTGSYSLSVQHREQRIYDHIRPYPVQARDDAPEADFSAAAYRNFNSEPSVIAAGICVLRDFRVLQLSINPLAWNAATGELTHCTDIQIEITFSSEPGANEMPQYQSYSPAFRELYAANLLNFEDYRRLNPALDGGRILLIHWNNTDATFQTILKNYLKWKRQKGHEVLAVSTQITGTSNTAIRNYIQSQYDNPATRPDFIILLGDVGQVPTWTENYSGYGGEGDYPYTFMAGNDTLGDLMIGRISVETIPQMAVMMEKIYRYERDIVINSADWVNRILLIGDPSTSGISCVYTSKYIKELAQKVNPDYSFIENYSGGYSSTINSAINQGVNFFSYRGYINMSGWSPGSSLANGPRLPHAVILTCSTGSFAGTATTESFVRLGTTASPAGAVTAIGMATTGTHTMFNNNLACAIFNGIFSHNMRSMGEALLNGRLYLNEVYGATHQSQVNSFAHWCNLMGDPSMEVFVGIPEVINLGLADALPLGSLIVDAACTDNSGNPKAEVCVTAFRASSNSILAKAYSDAWGNVSLQIPGGLTEALIITASKHDHKPAQATVNVAEGGIVANGFSLYDDGSYGSEGDGDALARGGETVALIINVRNTASLTLSGLDATVSCIDPLITLSGEHISFGDLDANASAAASTAILLQIDHSIKSYHDIRLELSLTDASGNLYEFPLHIPAYNAELEVEFLTMSAGGNSILDPTETGSLQIGLKNTALVSAQNLEAELFALNDLVVVNQAFTELGDIAAGNTGFSTTALEIFARSILVPGMQMPFRLRIFNAQGFEQSAFFQLEIGSVNQNTPLGPDAYGYFIYDETDAAYMDCPQYSWIEIHPAQGGSGTKLTTLNDAGTTGDEGDQNHSTVLEVLSLPFPFVFYGRSYDEISVCANGFIAMGRTADGEFRNSRLPGGLGPSPMIAAFWDDLILISDGGVYQYYDATNHLFIVEYYKMRNGYNRSSLETFQVIFYDPVYHPSSLGDGKIKIQYKEFNNVDVGGSGYSPLHGNFCTVGIKDHSNTRGLEYSYNNGYPSAAAPLSSGKALLISTVPVLHQNPYLIVQDLLITDANANGILEPGETAELGIRLINQGLDEANQVSVQVEMQNPYAQISNPESSYPNIAGDAGAVNSYPILINISYDCPAGTILNFIVNVHCAEGNWIYPFTLQVQKPQLHISEYYINDAAGNGNGLADPGETFELVVNFANPSALDAINLTSNIFCLSEYVSIPYPELLLPNVPAGSVTQAVYELTISPDAAIGNNLTFYITYLSELVNPQNEQLLISLGTTGMSADFEATNGGLIANPDFDAWQWGVSTYAGAHSGGKVWGTRLNAQYANNAAYTLTTPAVYIGSSFMLEFWHLYDCENSYDGGSVLISTDGGSTWNLLQPDHGYPHQMVSALGSSGFSGQSGGWVSARFPLSAYANQSVSFRFRFASDANTPAQGWFIDDLRTTGYIQFAGKLTGQVISSDTELNYNEVKVHSVSGILAYPDADGYYKLYLPMGSHQVLAESEGYHHLDPVSYIFEASSPVQAHDFYLGYLAAAENLSHHVQDAVITLNWSAPSEPEYELLSYELFRRRGAGLFESLASSQNTQYSESLPIAGLYQYYVKCLYAEGLSRASHTVNVDWDGVSNPDTPEAVLRTALKANYPNPFNPSTTIAFSLAEAAPVNLSIYNLRGQKVKSLRHSVVPAGEHSLTWNGDDDAGRQVSSGIYLIKLHTGKQSFTRKAMLMK